MGLHPQYLLSTEIPVGNRNLKLRQLLSSALNGGKRSATGFGRFTPFVHCVGRCSSEYLLLRLVLPSVLFPAV